MLTDHIQQTGENTFIDHIHQNLTESTRIIVVMNLSVAADSVAFTYI